MPRLSANILSQRDKAREACAAAAAAHAQRKAAIAAATEQARIRGFWSDYSLKIYREQMDEIEACDRAGGRHSLAARAAARPLLCRSRRPSR